MNRLRVLFWTLRFFVLGSGTWAQSRDAAAMFVHLIGDGIARGYSQRKLPR